MPGIQSTTFTYTYVQGRAAQPGTGSLTLFASRNVGATVAANVVKSYQTSEAVKTDQADGSLAHEAAKLAVQNIQSTFRIGAFADKTAVAANSRTFGTATVGNNSGGTGAAPTGFDPLLAASLPLYEVTTVSIDGVLVDRILYTTGDATAATLDNSGNGEVIVNPYTGSWKTSRSTSGSGAGVVFVYKSPNLTTLKEQALMQPIEVVTFAGWRYNAQHYGVYKDLVAWAETNGLMVYAAMDDSLAAPTAGDDVDDLIRAIRSNSFQTVVTKIEDDPTGDLTTAYAAAQAGVQNINGTMKKQPAPRGFTYSRTLPYTRSEFGTDVDPSVGTFHEAGVNVITLDNNTFVYTNDRCMTDYSASSDVLFGGVQRTLNATLAQVQFETDTALTTTGDETPIFDDRGLLTLKGAAKNGLNKALRKRWIREDYSLVWPASASDTDAADRKERSLVGCSIGITITTAIQTVRYTVEVAQ
jgi:hypothetical protein